MQNRQNGRRRRGSGGNNPRPMGQPMGGQTANRLEVRVRGNAHQLLDKYKVLARDAHQAGDRVAAEYYLQHADHYFRVLNDSRIRQDEMRARRGVFDQYEDDAQAAEGDDGQGDGGDGADDGDLQGGQQDRFQDRSQDRSQDRGRGQRQEREPRQERRPRYEPRDRPEQRERPEPREQEGLDANHDRPRRWQQDRPAERSQERDSQDRRPEGRADLSGEPDFPRSDEGGRARRSPRLRAEPAENRISDGEAALVAFGGVPVREPARDVPSVPEAAEEEAPKPRRRGRPKKAEVEPIEG